MKMSDVFDLPLKSNSGPFIKDNSGGSPIYSQSVFNDFGDDERIVRAKAITHAINNHDRLTEENAKLREIIEMVIFEAERNFDNSIDIDDLKEQLNQLKDQNNDK